jgi:hypothetical protein
MMTPHQPRQQSKLAIFNYLFCCSPINRRDPGAPELWYVTHRFNPMEKHKEYLTFYFGSSWRFSA